MAQIDFKSPALQKAALTALLGCGLLGVFLFTHFVPFSYPNQRERIDTLKDEYEKKATELSRARATVADLPRFEAEYAHLHERWAQAAELLPTERQMPVLMRHITLAAQQNGVGLTAFRPSSPKQEEHYTETPIRLSAYGAYHQIGAFMADLANMRRIVTVSNVQLRPNVKGKTSGTTSAEFDASAYYLNSTAAASASAAPASPTAAPGSKKEGAQHVHKES